MGWCITEEERNDMNVYQAKAYEEGRHAMALQIARRKVEKGIAPEEAVESIGVEEDLAASVFAELVGGVEDERLGR